MTSFALRTASAALLAALSFSASAASGWTFLPIVNDPAYKFAPSVALTVNSTTPANGNAATGAGLELGFNCGLIQSPDQRIRTSLNISRTDKDGVKATAFELSPRYTVPLSSALSVGVGPSLGLFQVDAGTGSKNLFGVGVAAGVNYRMGQFFTGADLRYHATKAKDGVDFDPTTVSIKVGVNF